MLLVRPPSTFRAFSDAALRPAKILLGVFAVTAPVLEWLLMSGLLRSGYLGG